MATLCAWRFASARQKPPPSPLPPPPPTSSSGKLERAPLSGHFARFRGGVRSRVPVCRADRARSPGPHADFPAFATTLSTVRPTRILLTRTPVKCARTTTVAVRDRLAAGDRTRAGYNRGHGRGRPGRTRIDATDAAAAAAATR